MSMNQIHFQLEKFSGPLDLLLGLIDEQKLSLSDLALSEVTEQYLVYIESLEEERPDELADFLVVATRLLLLKSKMLLPQFSPEEEEGPSLEEQLRLYQAFRSASRKLEKAWLLGRKSFFRIEPPRRPEVFSPPANVTNSHLHGSFLHLLERLKPAKALPTVHIDKTVSIKEKMEQIRELLRQAKNFSFFDTLENAENKSEVIMSFLALLELVKQRLVFLRQEDNFSDISIESMN